MASTFYRMSLLLFCLFAWVSWVQSQTASLSSSKRILTSAETSVILNCVPNGINLNPYSVIVFTLGDAVIYNSSNPYKIASDVQVINQTAISYSSIRDGISNVGCRINSTYSVISTIPYLGDVTLTHSHFNMSDNFTIRCGFSILPSLSRQDHRWSDGQIVYVVSLTLNQTEIGQYHYFPFRHERPDFTTPFKVAGLEVSKGNESNTFIGLPTNPNAEGKYRCLVAVTVLSANVTVNVTSEEWNTSGHLALLPSTLLFIFTSLLLFFGNGLHRELYFLA